METCFMLSKRRIDFAVSTKIDAMDRGRVPNARSFVPASRMIKSGWI